MRSISKEQIIEKMRTANSWWASPEISAIPYHRLRSRRYFHLFRPLAVSREPKRALVLMGPRRVGKTVLVFHLIRWLLRRGVNPQTIFYLDLQQPIYNGLSLEELTLCAIEASGANRTDPLVVCFDEIQYLRDWEVHLRVLVDSYPSIKFIATGSAAAALRLKSTESGAGRFTDFLLPPLTFYEYIDLLELTDLVRVRTDRRRRSGTRASSPDIAELNRHFVEYLNCGGYPEAVFSKEIRADLGRYIRSDIIDKVLLKDLPSLYGIQDIPELNSLFANLAYNTANEVSLNELSQNSGVSKNTIKRYIEYLQSAFLIKIVHRIDHSARRFQRAHFFKVYLTNPSMRTALFSPVGADDEDMGCLVETAVFAQWFHSIYAELYYAHWKDGEVDIVYLDPAGLKPSWAVEVKWSDRFEENPTQLRSLFALLDRHPSCKVRVTTRTRQSSKTVRGRDIGFMPASLYCYVLGHNIIKGKQASFAVAVTEEEPKATDSRPPRT